MLNTFVALLQLSAPVQGTVREQGTLEPVPYAIVEIIGTQRQAVADVRGFFTVAAVPLGTHTMRVRAIGFTPVQQSIEVAEGSTTRVEILLRRLAVTIAPVLIVEDREEGKPAGPPPVRLDPGTIHMIPSLGEMDVLRALQALPSVQQASDFSGALYMRGGSPDQTVVTLDGVPLFNPYHLGGIFAAIDPDAIATLDVFPGAVPAHLGDRLSGMVELWTREGGRDRARSRGSIGFVSSRASVDGPLPGGRGSYLVSGRRTYLDLFTSAGKLLGLLDQSLPYHFTDAHVKLVHDVGTLGRLSASAYYNQEQLVAPKPLDQASGTPDDDFDWGSRAVALDWRQPFGGHFMLETRAGFSNFRSEIDFFDEDFNNPQAPPIQTMRGRAYMRDALASAGVTAFLRNHEVRVGAQMDAYRLDYDVTRSEDQFFADLLPELQRAHRRTTTALYATDSWQIAEPFTMRAGVRALSGVSGTEIMPRFGAVWRPHRNLSFEAGGGTYSQALHSFRNEESLLASFLAYDLLAPSDTAGLARSWDVVAGAEWRNDETSIRVDAYEKRFLNLPIPPIPPDPFEAPLLDVELVDRGQGRARGLELLLRRGLGERRAIFGSYALSSVTREIGEDRFKPRFDRTHTLDITGSFPIGRKTDGSARVVAASGQPYTPVQGRFSPITPGARNGSSEFEGSFFPIFALGAHNTARLPGYTRLDVSLRRTGPKRWFGRQGEVSWTLQVINVLNMKNVLGAQPRAFSRFAGGELEFLPQLPIVPSFAMEWRF